MRVVACTRQMVCILKTSSQGLKKPGLTSIYSHLYSGGILIGAAPQSAGGKVRTELFRTSWGKAATVHLRGIWLKQPTYGELFKAWWEKSG